MDFLYKDGKLYRNGREAGWVANTGYRAISYNNRKYLTHRVIWYIHHGGWPSNHIDHINQDRLDNRIENLRDVSRSVNLRNQRRIKGYHFHKPSGKWRAQMSRDNRIIHIGLFSTEREAREAYLKHTTEE